MTSREAAVEILKQAGEPLHLREITRRILEQGLWTTPGKTPAATIEARIATEIKENGARSVFVRVEPRTFGLRELRAQAAEPPRRVERERRPRPKAQPRETYSFAEAAEKVLEQFGKRQPMHYRAMTAKALEMGWLATEGKTPEASMYTSILMHIKRCKRRGEEPRFAQHGQGLIGLTKWISKGQIERHGEPAAQAGARRRKAEATASVPRMTNLDAALRVLKEADGGPLHYREITRRALEAGYLQTKGKTPEASVGTQLYTHIKKAETAGLAPKVRRIGKGLFALSAKTTTGAQKLAEEADAKVRAELFARVLALHPRAFEYLIGRLLTSIGFEDVEVTNYSRDGGLDLTAELTVGGVTSVRTAIQAKRWRSKVSGKTVRELRGSTTIEQRGLIIATSSFTRDAREEASAESKKPISLVDGEKLLDLLIDNQIGVTKKTLAYLELDLTQFDELEETDEGGNAIATQGKYMAIWPVPGGWKKMVDSVVRMLKHVAQAEPSHEQMVNWVLESYSNVSSTKTTSQYIRVLVILGLLAFDGEVLKLTHVGTDALTGDPSAVLLKQLRSSVAGVQEYLEALEERGMTQAQSHSFFKDTLAVDWVTEVQTTYRLVWLECCGAIVKVGDVYRLA